jgi:hypothetical protein
MKISKIAIAFCILAFGYAGAASAALGANGFTPNGFTPNGFTPNGFTPNGFTPNGFTPNGFTPNGFTPNGFTPNGFTPNGIGWNSASPAWSQGRAQIRRMLSCSCPSWRRHHWQSKSTRRRASRHGASAALSGGYAVAKKASTYDGRLS